MVSGPIYISVIVKLPTAQPLMRKVLEPISGNESVMSIRFNKGQNRIKLGAPAQGKLCCAEIGNRFVPSHCLRHSVAGKSSRH